MQQELAEYYGVSQPTISRAITAITPELARVMRPFTPTAEELPSDEHHRMPRLERHRLQRVGNRYRLALTLTPIDATA